MKNITTIFFLVLTFSSFPAFAQVYVRGEEAAKISNLLTNADVPTYQRIFFNGTFTYHSLTEINCSLRTQECTFTVDYGNEEDFKESSIQGESAIELLELMTAHGFTQEEGGAAADSLYCGITDRDPNPFCVMESWTPCYGI
jgi:hypothetical protein